MNDLISRQAVMNAFAERVKRSNNSDFAPVPGWNDAVEIVENLPSTDAVEVVRCRDCKHNPNDTWFECPIANLPYKEDRWCWKGERKDD